MGNPGRKIKHKKNTHKHNQTVYLITINNILSYERRVKVLDFFMKEGKELFKLQANVGRRTDVRILAINSLSLKIRAMFTAIKAVKLCSEGARNSQKF